MQKLLERIRKLCTPAYVYLVISVVTIAVMMGQNLGNDNEYCVGEYSCRVPSTTLMFVIKAVSVAFWTIVLNSLCDTGYTTLSWFLVIMPFLGAALGIAALMTLDPLREE